MFELFRGDRRQTPHRHGIPVLISTAVHVVGLGVLLAVPLLYVTAGFPEVPGMTAFVVSAATVAYLPKRRTQRAMGNPTNKGWPIGPVM